MNELVHIDNQQVVTDSRNVAEHFGKRHDHVVRDIETILGVSPKLGTPPKCSTKQHTSTNRTARPIPCT